MPRKSAHPYVVWRDGRPRFVPSPELRKLGHKGQDLRHEDGRWFSRGEAVDWSDRFCKQLEKAPAPRPAVPAPVRQAAPAVARPDPTAHYSLAQLFHEWQGSAKFQLPRDLAERQRQVAAKNVYAPKTISDYRQKASVLERHDPTLWAAPASSLMTPIVYGLYDELRARHGISTARGAIAVLSAALSWGRRRGKVNFKLNDGAHPAKDLDMATPPPRIRVATRLEVETLIAVADHVGRPEAGDMTLLGVWTGQRQGDRLALEDKGLVKGRRVFRQGKTGAIVAIREVPELARRLAASQERRRAPKAAELLAARSDTERAAIEKRFSRVILNELVDARYGKCFWRPFQGQTYSHLFAEVRDLAVEGVDQIKPCPSLAGFQEPDLRDTAVTWMALGGATIPEICGVTGHSLQSATRILKHYLAMHPDLADAAIGKMLAWYEGGEEIVL